MVGSTWIGVVTDNLRFTRIPLGGVSPVVKKLAPEPGLRLRADARRNVEKLKAAAAEAFSENGLDTPLEVIAARAGVSVGTIYNRLGSREALIDAAIADKAAAFVAAAVESAEAISDPWARFVRYMEEICAFQARDFAFNDVLARARPEAERINGICDEATTHAAEYMKEAQRAGALRLDASHQDIFVIFWSTASLIRASQTIAPDAWRRNLALTLDGLRTGAPHPLPPLAQSMKQRKSSAPRTPRRR
jgi:AcrR family transcriptional regulator